MSTIDKVAEFHRAFCPQHVDLPAYTTPDKQTAILRLQLIQEELAELAHGLAADDPVEILDALTDLQYVIDGTYLSLGLDKYKEAAFNEVHRSNMSKLDENGKPILNEAGRVCKSHLYTPPDLKSVYESPQKVRKYIVYDELSEEFCLDFSFEKAMKAAEEYLIPGATDYKVLIGEITGEFTEEGIRYI